MLWRGRRFDCVASIGLPITNLSDIVPRPRDGVGSPFTSDRASFFFSGLNRILSGIPRSSFPPVLPNAPIAFLPSDFSLPVTCAFSGQPAIRISSARRIFDQERRRSVLLLSNQPYYRRTGEDLARRSALRTL
jgi:hypothetical protein